MIETTITIFIVGMISVFTVLGIVIVCAHSVIYITNRWSPIVDELQRSSNSPSIIPGLDSIPPAHKAAIESAILQLTNGRGSVKQIERILS